MKKISAILLASTILFPFTNVSATTIESNLLTEFGGVTGYGEKVRVYDPFSAVFEETLPFAINVNDLIATHISGDITGNFVLSDFPRLSPPGVVAPFEQFSEPFNAGSVYSGTSEGKFSMTWDNILQPFTDSPIEFNPNDSSPESISNTFQLVLIDRTADTGQGNFDVEFRYDNIDWWSEQHPLITPETVFQGDDVGGVELFQVRNGLVTPFILPPEEEVILPPVPDDLSDGSGTTADPFMPIVDEESDSNGWNFAFQVTEGDFQAIDPDVAIGYEYIVNSGPNVQSVILPTGYDDDLFDIFTKDNGNWLLVESDWQAGVQYDFLQSVSEFKIEGIDISNSVRPDDPLAFITQIAFDGSGFVDITQTPLTEFVDVPEPQTLFMFSGALGILAFLRKRKLTIS
tara:strand:+ start:5505 stop:6710 length:1206 start_codon:yes stop_codon:yes gene_type:complete